ncbi:MAG: phenylacetate--CoA ligase family protein [Anaerolineae bacterium]|nr:phenylacetate--CoA ligase family protein [Anaerolineae bacterium]
MNITPLEAWIAHKIGADGTTLTRAKLEAYQLERLQATLDLARARSRFYRDLFADAPLKLTQLADLSQLPFTTAEDIRSNPLHFVCVSQDAIQRVVTLDSSGTTGNPKRIYFTREDQELTIDFFAAGMSTFTAAGDRVLILLPGPTPGSVGDLLATALDRIGAVAIKHGPVRAATATLDVIRREGINVLVGVPTQVLALARSPDQPPVRLKSVLLTTDHVPDAIKRAVESVWQCAVYNHYGMTEMGLGGGVDCAAHHGYHVREADMLFEIVDPVTGLAVPDGDYGEVAFTTLTRDGMPLIRYRTGDVSRFLVESCACGTTLRTLERVRYRLSGRVALGDGYLTMADLDEALFGIEAIRDFRAAVEREQGRDCLVLDMAWNAQEDLTTTLDALLSAVPILQGVGVRVQSAGTLAASMAKRVIMDRKSAHDA